MRLQVLSAGLRVLTRRRLRIWLPLSCEFLRFGYLRGEVESLHPPRDGKPATGHLQINRILEDD